MKSHAFDLKEYMLHCAGVYKFHNNLYQQKIMGVPATVSDKQIVFLNKAVCSHFLMGKDIKSKTPILCLPGGEMAWFEKISWSKCIWDAKEHLYFLSKDLVGNNYNTPDMPPFAVAIQIDSPKKIEPLIKTKEITVREYFNDEGRILVNHHKKAIKLPVAIYSNNEKIVPDVDYETRSEILRKREMDLIARIPENLNFVGNQSEALSAAKKWEEKDRKLIKGAEDMVD